MKNVANPPRTSRSTVEPRAETRKKRSSGPEGPAGRRGGALSDWVDMRGLPSPTTAAGGCGSLTGQRAEAGGEPTAGYPADVARPARRPDPPPLRTDERRVVAVVMAAWALAGIVLAVGFRGELARHDASWWLWTTGVGFALGGYGLYYYRRR